MRAAAWLSALLLAELLAAAVTFSACENVSFWLSCYWALETATTVGYGDVVPHAASAHVIASVTMLVTIPTLGALTGRLFALHASDLFRRRHAEALDSASAAHQIAADLYREQTGTDHPSAPGVTVT